MCRPDNQYCSSRYHRCSTSLQQRRIYWRDHKRRLNTRRPVYCHQHRSITHCLRLGNWGVCACITKRITNTIHTKQSNTSRCSVRHTNHAVTLMFAPHLSLPSRRRLHSRYALLACVSCFVPRSGITHIHTTHTYTYAYTYQSLRQPLRYTYPHHPFSAEWQK